MSHVVACFSRVPMGGNFYFEKEREKREKSGKRKKSFPVY